MYTEEISGEPYMKTGPLCWSATLFSDPEHYGFPTRLHPTITTPTQLLLQAAPECKGSVSTDSRIVMDRPVREMHLSLNPSAEALVPHATDSNGTARSPSLDGGIVLKGHFTDPGGEETVPLPNSPHRTDNAAGTGMGVSNSPSLLPGPTNSPTSLGWGLLPESPDDSAFKSVWKRDRGPTPGAPSLAPGLWADDPFGCWYSPSAPGNMVGGPAAPTAGPSNVFGYNVTGLQHTTNEFPSQSMPETNEPCASPEGGKEPPSPSFPLMKLPRELRNLVYKHILRSSRPIDPHLCDPSAPVPSLTIPKFHDDNQTEHNATSLRLGILSVCKEVRNEALPVFYSANTFAIGKDTASYFDRLECLGRFGMVRNVQFSIVYREEEHASEMLQGMVSYLRAKKMYEDRLRAAEQQECLAHQEGKKEERGAKKEKLSIAALVGKDRTTLMAHPQYLVGGLEDLNVAVCLAKLCTVSSAAASTTDPNTLTLPFPRHTIFDEHPTLSWFPLVTSGLGMSLHLVPGEPFDATGPRHVTLTWRQRWGHKTHDGETECSLGPAEVERRALALQTGLQTPSTHRVDVYYRSNCGGGIQWYDIPAVGRGGMVGAGLVW